MKELLLSLGLYDDPSNQKQDRYDIDLYTTNLAIFGSAMTGKTYLLKWILLNIHYLIKSTQDEEIYILDFSNNLSEFKKLPLVMGYFDAFNEENIRRVFKVVEERYISNVRALPGKNFLQRDADTSVKHITFILDGIHVLFADNRYQKYQERLFALARDGLSKGISVIFTATEPINGVAKMLSSFDRKIAFAVSPDSYSNIYFGKVDIPMNKPGRGVANVEGTSVYEFQAFLPYDTSNKNNTDHSVVEDMITRLSDSDYFGIDGVNELLDKHLESIADTLSEKNWNEYVKPNKEWMISKGQKIGKAGHLVAGIDYYLCTPIDINLEEAKTIAIYGKKDSGKTNLLKLILRGLLLLQENNNPVRIVYWDDTREGLLDPISGVGSVLNKFNDTKQINSEEQFVKYLCEDQHYCVLEEVGPERAHAAKLIAVPNQKYLTDKPEVSHKPIDDELIPLSDGSDYNGSVEEDNNMLISQNEELSSLISSEIKDVTDLNHSAVNGIPENTVNNEKQNESSGEFSNAINETESLEDLQDSMTIDEVLEKSPETKNAIRSVEELREDNMAEEATKELPEFDTAEFSEVMAENSDDIGFDNVFETETDSDYVSQEEIYDDPQDDHQKTIFDDEEEMIESNSESQLEESILNDGMVHEKVLSSATNNNKDDKKIINDNPFTVFIIQSRSFYVKAIDSQSHIITRLVNYISECDNVLFVFSDTQPIQDYEVRYHFNSNIRYAFLFDDIVKYIEGRGSRSIFSQYDLDELKENFGRNEKGDAFLYDVMFEKIQKIKVILDE